MIFLIGQRQVLRKTEYIPGECPDCGAANNIFVNIYQNYVCVFLIPVFPDKKVGTAACYNCRHVWTPPQMTWDMKTSYEAIRKKTKPPVWTFSGVFLAVLGTIAAFIFGHFQAEKVSRMVLSPRKGDVFEFRIKADVYTLYKVQKVVGGVVFFYPNKYQTDQETGLSGLADKEYDESVTYELPISKLAEMDKDGSIIDIDRN